MTPEDLKYYTIKNASVSDLLVDWPFDYYTTSGFFYHGLKSSSLQNYLTKDSGYDFEESPLFDTFFIVENEVYYRTFKNNELLKLTAISYADLIACATHSYLLAKEKAEDFQYSFSCCDQILKILLCPLVHNEVLDVLKRDHFFEKFPLQVIQGFLYRIEKLMRLTHNHYLNFYSESRDPVLFFNILTFIGVSDKEASTLAENCVLNNDLSNIKFCLQELCKKYS